VQYKRNEEAQHCFFLEEQSVLQILRELPTKTPLVVMKVFSQRHRIAKKSEVIRASETVGELLAQTLPLIENGCLPCNVLSIEIDNNIAIVGRHDYSVELKSQDLIGLRHLLSRIFVRQLYSEELLDKIIHRPKLYHHLERPNKILSSSPTYDE